MFFFFFFFNDTATTEIYTLSLHDALPICAVVPIERELHVLRRHRVAVVKLDALAKDELVAQPVKFHNGRSEEHTSELQSRLHLVCRLLLEKKKKTHKDELSQ